MYNSIKYFEEKCIKRFEKIEDGIHSRTVDIYSFIQSCYGYDSF